MNAESIEVGTRVLLRHDDGDYVPGWYVGHAYRDTHLLRCDVCNTFHWVDAFEIYPVPDFHPEDFVQEAPRLTYRERLQIEEDDAQMEYLSRHAGARAGRRFPRRSQRYAALAFPLVILGLSACVVGGVNLADGHYLFGGFGVLLFVAVFILADRLERGV